VTLQLNRGESLKEMGRNPRFECGATRRIPSVSTDPESRGELIRAAFAMGVATLVDEAFIDYAPEESLSRTAAKLHGLVVLHTLTKTFAIPGLRVAYAVAHPEIRAAMESCIPAWSVDSVAADAARLLLADCASIAAARNANPRERNWLANALNSLGLEVFSSKANFLLVIQGLRPAKSHENASLSEIDFSMVSDDFRPCENRKGARGS
jgi:histidinol-phosphate/aromatic aminotransferase/cobyric acid decarboxylase-like protein